MLQPIASAQQSYIKDSFALKDMISELHLPPNALLFTCDAKSMYTNIPTEIALTAISQYITKEDKKLFHHYDSQALTEALQIVFSNNVIQFGDTYWRQTSGTGMGISPAPPWATIFYALHENTFLPQYSQNLIFYKRFIDDVLGIWLPHPCQHQNQTLWHTFKQHMQEYHGLEWDFTPLSTSCNFMDLTISVTNNHLTTTLFEKQQNLYLYIPPHSSHPTGMIQGLIHGNILRIHRLCTYKHDIQHKTQTFFQRLIHRGYSPTHLYPIFKKAEYKAAAFISNLQIQKTSSQASTLTTHHPKIFLHLQYHPQDPTRQTIQQLWASTVAKPPGKTPLMEIKNINGHKTGLDRLTIAYSRPQNLRNKLSVRKIHGRGMNVSSYISNL
jgi:hypothetical protein